MKYLIEDTEEVMLYEINQYLKKELSKTSLNKDDIVIDDKLKIKIAMVELARIFDENGMDGIYSIDLGTIHLNHTGNTISFSQEELMYRFENAYECIFSGIECD